MTLVEFILQNVPLQMLERVVADQGVLSVEQQQALFKASGLSFEVIAMRVVDAYGMQEPKLAAGLYDLFDSGNWEAAQILLGFFQNTDEGRSRNLQASLAARAPTVPFEELHSFMTEVKRRICLIVCRKGKGGRVGRGTGFLVAPDLVLTCSHVLKGFVPTDDVLAGDNRIELYFDFLVGDDPVDDIGPDLAGARKVGVTAKWHVARSESTTPDGMIKLTPDDAERIKKSLDFVLLQLDQQIGMQPLEISGGRRRGWIALPPADDPAKLKLDDWIIIPQHPNGARLRIDFGRYRESDPTETRIRYTTNTAPGSSGAPCFNQERRLVGMHNASIGPEHKVLANQAIRFDRIAVLISQHLGNASPQLTSARWSLSRPGEPPRVILGRDTLLDWLERSRKKEPAGLRDRVYAALASGPGAGCTFSSDVLHADLRGGKAPRAVYGSSGQQLPARAEDFVISLLRELGIDPEKLPTLRKRPLRPGAPEVGNQPEPLTSEVDKLERWLSDDLPSWVGEAITVHTEGRIDVRGAARQEIEFLDARNLDVPDDLRMRAESEEPIWQPRLLWERAYVVIDDLRGQDYTAAGSRSDFSGEVMSLIAALIKGKPEAAMPEGLKRLRWLFLGDLPPFIGAAPSELDGATVERLDPAHISEADILAVFNRMADAQLAYNDLQARLSAHLIAQIILGSENRLKRLQEAVNDAVAFLLNAKKN